EDYSIVATKIGMLPTVEAIKTVAAFIERHQLLNVVLDPVIRSSSGYDLIDDDAKKLLLEQLMPLATLVTPNLAEAIFFAEASGSITEDLKVAARKIYEQIYRYSTQAKHQAVLVKGGHLEGDPIDVLFDGQEFHEFQAPRIITRHTHGTGCTLSSAVAALLARGFKIPEAVRQAKRYVSEAIRTAPGLGHGAGPLNHMINGFEL
ncbi:MAG TPA: bifunctional hydroxymethylpyrimidine kinase/phosphomethylpyrimidine kinase, partial [Blastocatellia bacterium]|nr:bifunctional hydroxymethylpyrimidine kinase/phosphomethylpyrimidine kinase [Blastocatellia bacterium]